MNVAVLFFTSFFAATATRPPERVVIKDLAISARVVGGIEAPGTVELEITGMVPIPPIQLRSSNPAIAAVPDTVRPTQGTRAAFAVKTVPVTSDSDVTITASVGASVKTATLNILAPQLAGLLCDQQGKVFPAKPLTCTVLLNGLAAEDINVQLATTALDAIIPDHVTIPKKSPKSTFQITARPIAQSTSGQVSATYGRVTKSRPIRVMPVALLALDTSAQVRGGDSPMLWVELTAPAPQPDLTVKLWAAMPGAPGATIPISLPSSVSVPAGHNAYKSGFYAYPVSAQVAVTIFASSNFFNADDVVQTTVTILPATIKTVALQPNQFSNVPLGGVSASVLLTAEGNSPQDAFANLQYGGDTQIQGPAQIHMPTQTGTITLPGINISPCSVKASCIVTVTATYAGKQVQGSAMVNQH